MSASDLPCTDPAPTLGHSWRAALRERPALAGGLLLIALGLLWLTVLGARNGAAEEELPVLRYAALGGGAGFAATALGALIAVALRQLSARAEDTLLGFAAGMMLAASSFSLIIPGIDAARDLTGNGVLAALTVVLGMGLGVVMMLGMDRFTPHEHPHGGPCGPGAERLNRVWLFVFAITLHNLPEGMAIGVSFAHGDLGIGMPLTSAIALQDIPEGLAVAVSLRAAGLRAIPAALIAAASGLMEPLGSLLGLALASSLPVAYPLGMGLAAGAMLFVVSHEVIPETHRNGHQTPATLGLMVGFAVMLVLDTGLG